MRKLVVLAIVAIAVAAGAYFADHPGRVEITWQGWLVETSVGVLAAAAALFALVVAALALVAAALRRLPANLRRRRATRRRQAGEAALIRGVVALAAGQPGQARLAARRAAMLLDGAPIALLLAAEAARREGDAADAQRAYSLLLERPESEFLGLRGLIGEALRAGDDDAARRLATRAQKLRPDAGWLGESLLVLAARAGDWEAARRTLSGALRRGLLPAERARHHRGVVLHELSRAAERDGDKRRALRLASQAQALVPDLAAPAVHLARLLSGLGRRRAASRAIERAWATAPHPDLAALYLELHPDLGLAAQTALLEGLAARNPAALESHIAVAEAALAARLLGEARRHLALAIAAAPPPGPAVALCRLMARLEESVAGNVPASREWLDRALAAPPDRAHVCRHCGAAHALWQALCPECGAFDTLEWTSPPAAERAPAAPLALAEAPLMLPGPDLPPERLGVDRAIG
jgi:HemY protein